MNNYTDFPFEEIRKYNGDYFSTVLECINAGFDVDQIWSLTLEDDIFYYGPSRHSINRIGLICTQERHDGQTYFMEEGSFAKDEDEPF